MVAFAVFMVMVAVCTWFIKVWMTADLEQRTRQDALTTVSNCLERVTLGLMLPDSSTTGPTLTAKVQRVSVRQAFAQVPGWAGQLAEDECPAMHRASVDGTLYGGRVVKVQVTG